MIELVTAKDMADMWQKVEELIVRTKRHTEQIRELKGGLKDENNKI